VSELACSGCGEPMGNMHRVLCSTYARTRQQWVQGSDCKPTSTPSPAPDPVETVEVIQADRDAAADYYQATASHRTDGHIARLVRQGNHGHMLAAAFARHRQAALAQPAVKTVCGCREALEQVLAEASHGEPLLNVIRNIARTALSSPCIRER